MPDYLTDAERALLTPDRQRQYAHYAVFRLHGVIYTRWYRHSFARTAHLTSLGVMPSRVGSEPNNQTP